MPLAYILIVICCLLTEDFSSAWLLGFLLMFCVEVLKDIGRGQEHQVFCLPTRYPRSPTPFQPLPEEDGSVGRLNFLGNKAIVPKRFCDADTNGGSQFHARTLVSRILMCHCYLLMRSSQLAKGVCRGIQQSATVYQLQTGLNHSLQCQARRFQLFTTVL